MEKSQFQNELSIFYHIRGKKAICFQTIIRKDQWECTRSGSLREGAGNVIIRSATLRKNR